MHSPRQVVCTLKVKEMCSVFLKKIAKWIVYVFVYLLEVFCFAAFVVALLNIDQSIIVYCRLNPQGKQTKKNMLHGALRGQKVPCDVPLRDDYVLFRIVTNLTSLKHK